MKKYLLLFCLSGFFLLNSCQKESLDDKQSIDNKQEGEFISVEAPNGQVYQLPVPKEGEVAQSRCSGDCNSVMTFYVFPQNNQSSNVQVSINYESCAGGQTITLSNDNSTNHGLVDGGSIQMQFYNFGASTTDFLLLVGHWDCGGGTFDFLDVCSSTPYGTINIGTTAVCFGKCNLNAFGNSFGNC